MSRQKAAWKNIEEAQTNLQDEKDLFNQEMENKQQEFEEAKQEISKKFFGLGSLLLPKEDEED